MLTLLIITEDIVKIQTLTGVIGKTFSWIYLNWLKLRLKLLIICLNPFFDLKIFASDYFQLGHKHFTYGDQLSQINYSKNRLRNLRITKNVLKNQDSSLFQIRLATYLTYHFFIYADLYQIMLDKVKPDLVLTLSRSYHEQTALYVSKLNKIKTKTFSALSLNRFHRWLKYFLLNREYKLKVTNFLNQAKSHPRPSLSKMKNSILLSLDFHRHLKTLAPLYKILEIKKQNPWFVTDILNLNSALSNLSISSANCLYLASFLPESAKKNLKKIKSNSENIVKKIKFKEELDLDSYLYNLAIKVSKPIIKHCLVLAYLYQQTSENLINKLNPKSIVVVSDSRFCELALCQQATKHNIFSLLVSPNQFFDLAELNSYDTTEKVTVVGRFIEKQLIKQGVKPGKISIIGDIQSEESKKLLKQDFDNKEVYRILNINKDKKIILLISFRSTWMIPKDEKKAFFQMASLAVSKIPNAVLVIKPHPTEKRYRVLDELSEWGITNAIISDNNKLELFSLLNSCQVVLQTWSMTIFEAIMAKKPVISINPFNKNYGLFVPILNQGGAVVVSSQQKLNFWLKTFIEPENSQTKAQLIKALTASNEYINPPDGQVAERLANMLI